MGGILFRLNATILDILNCEYIFVVVGVDLTCFDRAKTCWPHTYYVAEDDFEPLILHGGVGQNAWLVTRRAREKSVLIVEIMP